MVLGKNIAYPETSFTTSLTKAVRLLRWPLVRETRGFTWRGVTFCIHASLVSQKGVPQFPCRPPSRSSLPILLSIRSRWFGGGRTWPLLRPVAMPDFCWTSWGIVAVVGRLSSMGGRFGRREMLRSPAEAGGAKPKIGGGLAKNFGSRAAGLGASQTLPLQTSLLHIHQACHARGPSTCLHHVVFINIAAATRARNRIQRLKPELHEFITPLKRRSGDISQHYGQTE